MGGLLSSSNYPTLHPLRLTGLLSELNLTEMRSWSLFLTNYSTYHSFLINLPCSLRAHYVNLITSKSLLSPLQLLWLTLSQLSSKVQSSLNHSSNLKFHSELLSSPQLKTGPWLKVFLWERAFLLILHFPSSFSSFLSCSLLDWGGRGGIEWRRAKVFSPISVVWPLFSFRTAFLYVCCLHSHCVDFFQKAWRWVWISRMHRIVLWVLGSGDLFLAAVFFHLLVLCLVAQTCPTLCDPMACSPPGSSVHRLFQARILEWVAISFSRRSFQPRDQTWVSCITGRFSTTEPPGKPKAFIMFMHLPCRDSIKQCLVFYSKEAHKINLWGSVTLSIQPRCTMVCLSLRHCQSPYLGGKEPPCPSILFWAHSSTTQMNYLFLDLI